MVVYKGWGEFEKEIISNNRRFYIYGAGMVYKKIIHAVSDLVLGVLDINAESVKSENISVPIIRPEKVLEHGSENICVLSCLNPFRNYVKRTGEICTFWMDCAQNVIVYYLDYQMIQEKGIIKWGGRQLLIDNLLYLVNEGWQREHMKLAYSEIADYNHEYIQKLYDEPAGYVLYGTGIGLRDYNNGLIIHKNGKKETIGKGESSSYSRTVWIFGDSRVSGMLNASDCTFASYLQKKCEMSNGYLNYRIMNCGMPGRDIERMVYQIQKEDIRQEDIVILATGFYEYEGDVLRNVLVWCRYIKAAFEICKDKKAEFIYINFPTILEMNSRSSIENEMLQIFNTTEFTEYKIDQMVYCKNIMRIFCSKSGILFFDFAEAFQNRLEYGHVFINLHHYGPNGNKLIADKLYEILLLLKEVSQDRKEEIEKLKIKRDKQLENKLKDMKIEENELQSYLNIIKEKMQGRELEGKHIGSIVMNANPFTYGHLFLIEEALKNVDFLIVFVVSEDASFFSFEERFEMVYSNLMNNDRVLVVPSGKYCISKQTFPDYFKKEDLQGEKTSAICDLHMFANKIAPKLHIEVRFVGDEPEDAVTKQYNAEMKKILPGFGIKVVEIPRKTLPDNTIISASKVRVFFHESRIEEIEKLVPEATLCLLKKYATPKERKCEKNNDNNWNTT